MWKDIEKTTKRTVTIPFLDVICSGKRAHCELCALIPHVMKKSEEATVELRRESTQVCNVYENQIFHKQINIF